MDSRERLVIGYLSKAVTLNALTLSSAVAYSLGKIQVIPGAYIQAAVVAGMVYGVYALYVMWAVWSPEKGEKVIESLPTRAQECLEEERNDIEELKSNIEKLKWRNKNKQFIFMV